MIIKNRANLGYVPLFRTTIDGSILLTQKEWDQIYPKIAKHLKAKTDTTRTYFDKEENVCFYIGKYATNKLISHCTQAQKYKIGYNYQIKII